MSDTEIDAAEFLKIFDDIDSSLIIDVRGTDEFAAMRLDGSENIPLDQLELRETYTALNERTQGRTIYLLCGVGMRAAKAQNILAVRGVRNTIVIEGGLQALQQALGAQGE